LETKIASKRTVQCDMSQRSFSERPSVSASIAYGEQQARSPDPAWHGVRVLCLARWGWDLPPGPSRALPVHRNKRVKLAWRWGGAALGWYTPSSCFFTFLAYLRMQGL